MVWPWKSFQQLMRRELPEAERLPPNQRWRVNEHLYRNRAKLGAAWSIPIVLVLPIAFSTMPNLLGAFNIPPALGMLLVVTLLFAAQLLILRWQYQKHGQRMVWQALNACGARTCESCGYDCRATEGPVCPECGGSLEGAAACAAATPQSQGPAGGPQH